MNKNKIKLILHVGAGKTGTTSIQKTLMENNIELKKQGAYYLGHMLENAYLQKYKWQKTKFYKMEDEEAEDQLMEILLDTIRQAKEENIHTLIWSNESFFFSKRKKILSILHKLKKRNIDLIIIAYVRRHDAWIRSAYEQWGIVHKMYRGEVRTFEEWLGNRDFEFYDKILFYQSDFPEEFTVRNMDAAADVVQDFFEICGIKTENIKQVSANVSRSNEELVLRSLYNSNFQERILPSEFRRNVLNVKKNKLTPTEYLTALMPSDEDYRHIKKVTLDDFEKLNQVLVGENQKPLSNSEIKRKSTIVDTDKLVMLLCEIVIDQSLKISNLEDALKGT